LTLPFCPDNVTDSDAQILNVESIIGTQVGGGANQDSSSDAKKISIAQIGLRGGGEVNKGVASPLEKNSPKLQPAPGVDCQRRPISKAGGITNNNTTVEIQNVNTTIAAQCTGTATCINIFEGDKEHQEDIEAHKKQLDDLSNKVSLLQQQQQQKHKLDMEKHNQWNNQQNPIPTFNIADNEITLQEIKDTIKNTIEETIKDSMDSSLGETIEDINSTIEETLRDKMDDSIKDALEDTFLETIIDTLKNTIDEKLKEETTNDSTDEKITVINHHFISPPPLIYYLPKI